MSLFISFTVLTPMNTNRASNSRSSYGDPEYANTLALSEFRAQQFPYLNAYLDWTGAGQPAASLLSAHTDMLRGHTYGNPHSESRDSLRATGEVETAGRRFWTTLGLQQMNIPSFLRQMPVALFAWWAKAIRLALSTLICTCGITIIRCWVFGPTPVTVVRLWV